MAQRAVRLALSHRGIVTVTLIAALLVNLLVIGRLQPPDVTHGGDLPLAARCQGGGPGCAEQPMIPPPSGGLPQFDAPPAATFGQLVPIAQAASPAVHELPPDTLERPPALNLAA